MKFVRNIKNITKNDVSVAGGKGASLGEMMKTGIPVPPGFVILAKAHEKFLKEKKIPEEFAQEIMEAFVKLSTEKVAVRSSATAEDSKNAAWAGQLESYLNTTEKDLLKNIQKCWKSLSSPRAKFYRKEQGLEKKKISVAVVVQKMVKSEIAGVAFSVHPVTEDKNQIVIEAVFGLGDALVSGRVTPDSYVIKKDSLKIVDIKKNGKQKLSEKQVKELAKLIIKIEKHYGFPVDVEWAFEKGKFWIVQSRPITTLSDEFVVNKKVAIEVEEFVHLSVPLSLVELHYEQESKKNVPWAKKKFNIKPYIFYKKDGNQVYFYYDPQGISWQMEHAGKYENENNAIRSIETHFNKVAYILKQEKSLNKKELALFLTNIRNLWPWMNYMWWAIEYKEKNGQIFDNLISIRKQTEYFTPGLIAVLRNSIKVIFPDKKQFADVLLLSEVERDKVPDESILRSRQKSFAYTNYKLFKSWGDLLDEFNVRIKQKIIGSKKNLEGQIAYPGYVKSRIRIVSNRKDIKKFKNGEILLASTTTPDYLPAMKRSSAIISEHGGMICHAAITSRELKIPCIVGVRNATSIFKNGDLVEVDANKGIVRKINN